MGDPFTTFVVFVGAIVGAVSFEVGLNTLQNYYDTFYQDAFWERSGGNPELERQLKNEEQEIEQLFQRTNFQLDNVEIQK